MTKGIFVVGAGRSGTKFVMNVLNNSEYVHIAPELHFFSWLIHSGFRKNLRKNFKRARGEYGLDSIVQCISSGNHFGTYWRRGNGIPGGEIEKWFSGKKGSEKNIYRFLIEYDAKAYSPLKKLKYTGEKTPSNIFHLGKISKWFPDAVFVFMYRNPLDVLRSEVNKGSKPDYPLNKRNPLYPYGLVVFVFAVWFLGALNALLFKRNYGNMYIVCYEEMSSRLPDTVRKLAAACGIEYTDTLCKVAKVDSSFGGDGQIEHWEPPGWVVFFYRLFLKPLGNSLYRKSIHHET